MFGSERKNRNLRIKTIRHIHATKYMCKPMDHKKRQQTICSRTGPLKTKKRICPRSGPSTNPKNKYVQGICPSKLCNQKCGRVVTDVRPRCHQDNTQIESRPAYEEVLKQLHADQMTARTDLSPLSRLCTHSISYCSARTPSFAASRTKSAADR